MILCEFEDGGKAKLRHVVIDAIVLDEDKILMVKRAKNLTEGGKWGLVGGFVERDEVLEEALHREVFEETGYKLKDASFFTVIDKSNRRNEDRQNIAFVYVCNVGEKTGEPDWESSEVKWFDLNSLPEEEEIAFDHFQIIKLYLKHKSDTFPKLINYLKE